MKKILDERIDKLSKTLDVEALKKYATTLNLTVAPAHQIAYLSHKDILVVSKQGLDVFLPVLLSLFERSSLEPIYKLSSDSQRGQAAAQDLGSDILEKTPSQNPAQIAYSIINEDWFTLSWLQELGETVSKLSPLIFLTCLSQSIIHRHALGRGC